ncbi:RRP6-like protein 3 isoform X2, partial [Tanacetum coccineum]
MKRLALNYHFVRERVTAGSLRVLHINSKDQLADMLTKPLGRGPFIHFCSKIRVCDGSSILRARMHDESLKYVLSDNAIVALAEKVPVTEADISTTISQADTHLGFLNSNSTTGSPSSVVISHLVGFRFLLQGELQNPDEILQLYIKKHLGPNGSCPLSLYNYGLLSKSNIEVPKRLVSKENGYKFS